MMHWHMQPIMGT